MNYKSVTATLLLLFSSMCINAQETFVIEGQIDSLDKKVKLFLCQDAENSYIQLAKDTLHGNKFRFELPYKYDKKVEQFALILRYNKKFSRGLELWISAGSHTSVYGDNIYAHTWKVKSDVPNQISCNKYIDDSRDLWNKLDALNNEKEDASIMLVNKDTVGYCNFCDSISDEIDKLSYLINLNIISMMKKTPVDYIWIKNFERLAYYIRDIDKYPAYKDLYGLYTKLTDEQINSPEGMNIKSCLYPVTLLKVNDVAADGDLFDIQGNVHHLADFKGKPILLDFWSEGCSPCKASMPDLKEISKLYDGKLVVISISIDKKVLWELASKKNEFTWLNFNELKGTHGLFAKYSNQGYPSYAFISADGRVVDLWGGYKKGFLLEKIKTLMEK